MAVVQTYLDEHLGELLPYASGQFETFQELTIYGCFTKNRHTPKWIVKTMENPITMDDLGVPLFLETPILNSESPQTDARVEGHFMVTSLLLGFSCHTS